MPRKRSRPFNKNDVKFVFENYSEMTASQIAEELGISKFQVSKIVSELRARGVDLPKKTAKRPNPVDEFLKEANIPIKKKSDTKKKK